MLPWSGGLLQQPKGTVLRLEAVLDASARFEDLEITRREAEIKLKTPQN